METYIARYEAIRKRVEVFSRHMRFDKYQNTNGRKLALSITEVVSLAVFKQLNGIPTKKAVYEMFRPACSYKTLVVSINHWSFLALCCLAVIVQDNRKYQQIVKHVDVIDIPVCRFKNAHNHKTMRGIATFSHTTHGTYFGLKLHLVSDMERKVLALQFTTANVDDRMVVESLTKGLTGIFVADGGYVSKALEQRFRKDNNRVIFIQPRNNMKKLMTKFQGLLMRSRMQIEFNFRSLKMFCGLITSLPRSVDGYLANYTYSLLAYLIA